MEILSVDYSGYITIDKNDLVVFRIDPETGDEIQVDTKELSTETILSAIKNGEFYVSLVGCLHVALDGEENIEVNLENTV